MYKVIFVIFFILNIWTTTTHAQGDPIGSVITPAQIPNTSDAISNYMPTIINSFLYIGLVALLLYLTYGGVRWIMAGGDQKALATARDTLTQAVIGFLLLSVAFAIYTIMNQFIGGNGGGPSTRTITDYRDINGQATDRLDLRRCGSNLTGSGTEEQVQCEVPYSGGSMSISEYNALPNSERLRYCVADVANSPTAGGGCMNACETNHSIGEYKYCQPR